MSRLENLVDLIHNDTNNADDINKRLSTQGNNPELIQRLSNLLQKIERNLNEVDRLLRSMSSEDRQYYVDDLEDDRKIVSSCKSNLQKCQNQPTTTDPNESKLREGNTKLAGANADLKNALEDAEQVDVMLDDMMDTLEEDHKSLEHIHQNVKDIDNEAETGIQRAGRMIRRICFNKFITGCIILVLIIVLAIVCFFRFHEGSSLYCHHHKGHSKCN